MKKTCYLVLDIGTTNLKAACLTPAGETLSMVQAATPTQYPAPDHAEMDPQALWAVFCRTARQAVREQGSAAVTHIALSSQMAGLVLMDGAGRPLTPVISGIDRRGEAYVPALTALFPAGAIYGVTGCPLLGTYWPGKLMWLADHQPGALAGAGMLAGVKAYLLWRLTGAWVEDGASASVTQLYDQRTNGWWPAMTTALSVAQVWLPRVASPVATLPPLTAEAVEALGLTGGERVLTGLGDGPAASLAAGGLQTGTLCVSFGTTLVTRYLTRTFAPRAGENRFYQLLAPGLWLTGERVSLCGAEIARAVAQCDGREAAVEDVYYWDGAFHGGDRLSPGQRLRAMLEGTLFAVLDSLDPALPFTQLRVSGGGSRNLAWMQAFADLFQLPVTRVATGEPLYGAAALCALADAKGEGAEAAYEAALAQGSLEGLHPGKGREAPLRIQPRHNPGLWARYRRYGQRSGKGEQG